MRQLIALAPPWPLLVLLALASLVFRRGDRGLSRPKVFSFALAVLLSIVAFSQPVDAMAEELFSAHMAQHLLIIMAIAPLLVLAETHLVVVATLPNAVRRPLARASPRLRPGPYFAICAWLVFCGAFVLWHLPGPYAWSYRTLPGHALEHASLFLSAYAFWLVALERGARPRIGHGAALFYVATAAVVSGLPGALMILASRPFYPAHAHGAALWGLTLVEDQQLAGLIMWVPGGLVYLALTSLLLARWLSHDTDPGWRRSAGVLLIAAGAVVLAPHRAALAQPQGDKHRGVAVIETKGCGACHEIPGVSGANGTVGPPLDHIGRRVFLAGELRNTPQAMAAWVKEPQKYRPGSAMPDMGLTDEEAQDVSAYLESLR